MRIRNVCLAAIMGGLSCAGAKAESVSYSKRMTVADGTRWYLCIGNDSSHNQCYVQPANNTCPDGYGPGGLNFTTKAQACSVYTTACPNGRNGC